MVAVALPLAPLAPGAAAAAGTFVAGSVAYVAQQVYGFRAPLPPLPRVGGKAGGPTLKELVADAIAGARVPVALPPNPLGPRGSWAAIGAAALLGRLAQTAAQLWGSLKQTRSNPAPDQFYPVGFRKVASGNLLKLAGASNEGPFGASMNEHLSLVNTKRAGPYGTTYWRHNYRLSNGTVTYTELPRSANEIAGLELYVLSGGVGVELNGPPVELVPGTAPDVEPAVVPSPLPAIPVPLIPEVSPLVAPDDPGLPQIVPTTPGPTAPPATAPQVPRRTVPLPLPGATPTKDGAIVPQAPAPVAITPPDAHFPVPGAPPVTGNGPRPTPEGIAQELGRLEQKLARLSDPGPAGNGDGTDRLGLLFQILGNVVEFLTSIQSGGGYGLSSPCELDENGERIVTTVEYSGAPTTLGVVLNKLDALAALLQAHKDLKQPICKQKPAVGQPVTVDFLQVD